MICIMSRRAIPLHTPRMHSNSAPADGIVMGHEILDLVAARGRCTLAELKSDAARVFGAGAVFGNCHGDRFDIDGLVEFLASKGKLSRVGDEVTLGHVPGCSGHGDDHTH
jgi:probable metal-binding protein